MLSLPTWLHSLARVLEVESSHYEVVDSQVFLGIEKDAFLFRMCTQKSYPS